MSCEEPTDILGPFPAEMSVISNGSLDSESAQPPSRAFSFKLPANVSIVTFGLFVAYGTGAWITINGLFSELPLIIDSLPESWAAASYITLIIQLANVGPLIYIAFQRKITLRAANVVVLMTGAVSMLLMAFFWDATAGTNHSVALFVLTFAASIADCTTSLIFWPFVSLFDRHYISALTAGEGLSGLLASSATWIQNSPEHGLLFSPAWYFAILALLLLFSLAAFFALERRVPPRGLCLNVDASCPSDPPTDPASPDTPPAPGDDHVGLLPAAKTLRWGTVAPPLLGMMWVSFCQNGVKPSIMAYATEPYGPGAYHLATNLGLCFDPFCAALSLVVRLSPRAVGAAVGAWTLLLAYVLGLALTSPSPPLKDDDGGAAMAIIASSLSSGLMALTKVVQTQFLANCIQSLCAQHLQQLHESVVRGPPSTLVAVLAAPRGEWLRAAGRGGVLPTLLGVAVQVGSLVGALLFFVLVNHTSLFKEG